MCVFKYQHVMLLVIDNVSVIKNWHLDTPDKPLDALFLPVHVTRSKS